MTTFTFRQSSVHLDSFSPLKLASPHIIPSGRASSSSARRPSSSDFVHPDHALYATTWFPPVSTSSAEGFVLVRLVENGYALELRWMNLGVPVQEPSTPNGIAVARILEDESGASAFSPSLDEAPPLPPVRILFPFPIVPDVALYSDAQASALHVLAFTASGQLYRLSFPRPHLFYTEPLPAHWWEEYDVQGVGMDLDVSTLSATGAGATAALPGAAGSQGKVPTLVSSSSIDSVLVACADGSLVKIDQARSKEGFVSDGHLHFYKGSFRVTHLRSSSLFSGVRSLLPFGFKSQSMVATSPILPFLPVFTSAPTHVLSMTSLTVEEKPGYAFTVSRDRKLRVWALNAENCLRQFDLPTKPDLAEDEWRLQLDRAGASSKELQEAASVFQPTARPLLRIITSDPDEDSPFSHYLIVFIPSTVLTVTRGGSPEPLTTTASPNFFVCYGLVTDSSGQLVDMEFQWDQTCDEEVQGGGAELRDIQIKRFNPAAGQMDEDVRADGRGEETDSSRDWTLWTLWEVQNRTVIKFATLAGLGGTRTGLLAETTIEEIGEDKSTTYADQDVWTTVAPSFATTTVSPFSPASAVLGRPAILDGVYFDEVLQHDSTRDVSEVFMERIFEPGRYSTLTIEQAIKEYERLLLAEHAGSQCPPALLVGYPTLAERVASIVACHVSLETSPQTGAFLYESFRTRVKMEWLRLVGLCEALERQAKWGLALAIEERRGVLFWLGRERVGTIVREDELEFLSRLANNEEETGDRPALDESCMISSTQLSRLTGLLSATLARCHLPPTESTTVANLLRLFHLSSTIFSSIPPATLNAFLAELGSVCSAPMSDSFEDMFSDLGGRWLEPYVGVGTDETASEAGIERAGKKVEGALERMGSEALERALRLSENLIASVEVASQEREGEREDGEGTEAGPVNTNTQGSPATLAFLTDSFSQAIAVRYDLAVRHVVLLLFIVSCSDAVHLVPSLVPLLSRALNNWHQLRVLNWLVRQGGSSLKLHGTRANSEAGGDEGLSRQLSSLSVVGNARPLESTSFPSATIALLQRLLQSGHWPVSLTAEQRSDDVQRMLPHAFYHLSTALLRTVAPNLVTSQADLPSIIEVPGTSVLLADKMRRAGFASPALQLITMYPLFDNTGGGWYIKARLEVELGKWEEARQDFEDAAATLVGDKILSSDPSTVAGLLPLSVQAGLSSYYRHVSGCFEEVGVHEYIAYFSKLAIEAANKEVSDGGEEMVPVDDEGVKSSWRKLFHAQVALGRYEEAYLTAMDIPYEDLKREAITYLVSVMCEASEVALLTRLPFSGFQAYVEQMLSFRARNRDALSHPNYHQVLYAYYMFRGDYRSAAQTMYEQARLLTDLPSRPGTLMDATIMQARSYLAAINALALVDKRHAWVTYQSAGFSAQPPRQRRKLSHYIPKGTWALSTKETQVVDLKDMRREYQLVAARLQLASRYPELAQSTMTMNPIDAVSLLSQMDKFEEATTLARVLEVDMSSIFEHVTARCVALATSSAEDGPEAEWLVSCPRVATWEGTTLERAWHYLHLLLEQHDEGARSQFRYRHVVLERILSEGRRVRIPRWLLAWFDDNDPAGLIRLYLRYGLIDEALDQSIRLTEKTPLPTAKASLATWLPYTLFDELLSVAQNPELVPTSMTTRELCGRLKTVLEKRFSLSTWSR